MSDKRDIDPVALTEILRDPTIVRIVSVLDIVSLSILELLEYNLTTYDVNRAMAKGVVSFDKSTLPMGEIDVGNLPALGDYYFRFLNSKVKLTDLGLYILETIKSEQITSQKEPQDKVEHSLDLPDFKSSLSGTKTKENKK
jgi:hypothetical protein